MSTNFLMSYQVDWVSLKNTRPVCLGLLLVVVSSSAQWEFYPLAADHSSIIFYTYADHLVTGWRRPLLSSSLAPSWWILAFVFNILSLVRSWNENRWSCDDAF